MRCRTRSRLRPSLALDASRPSSRARPSQPQTPQAPSFRPTPPQAGRAARLPRAGAEALHARQRPRGRARAVGQHAQGRGSRSTSAPATPSRRRNEVWLADLTGDLMREGHGDAHRDRRSRRRPRAWAARSTSASAATPTTIGGDVLTRVRRRRWSRSSPTSSATRSSRSPSCRASRPTCSRNLAVALSQPQQLALREVPRGPVRRSSYGRALPDRGDAPGLHARPGRAVLPRRPTAPAARGSTSSGASTRRRSKPRSARRSRGWEKGTPPAQPRRSRRRRARSHLIDRPGAVQSTIILGLPVVDPSHPDYIPLTVMDALLGGAFASRITKNIREDKGYTYSPYSELSTRYRDAYWAENADVTTNVTGPSIKEIFAEIDRLQAEPPSREELTGHPELPRRHLRAAELEPRRHHRPARVHGPARPAGHLRERLREAGLRGHAAADQRDVRRSTCRRTRHHRHRRRPEGHRGAGQAVRQNRAESK